MLSFNPSGKFASLEYFSMFNVWIINELHQQTPFFMIRDFAIFSNIFVKWHFRNMVLVVFLPPIKLLLLTQQYNFYTHSVWSTGNHQEMQVDKHYHKNMEHFCLFYFLISYNMEPNQFEWTFWTPSVQLHLAGISLLMVRDWLMLTKN